MTEGAARDRARRTIVYILSSAASVLLAFILTAAFLLAVGRDPLSVYAGIFMGAFGDAFSLSETLVAATPIMLCALAVAVAGWVGMMNIGVEGQLYMGAIGATLIPLSCPNLAAWEMLSLMFVSACAFGAVWAFIPAALRVWLGVSEVIVSLLLNYVASLSVDYLIHGPWMDPTSSSWPQTIAFPETAQLPHLPGGRVHLALALGLGFTLVFAVLLPITRVGFIARVIGQNPQAAEYAHYPVKRYVIGAMLLSGAIAAIAGFGQVSAIEGRLRSGLSPGYGYTGFLVCWLARHNPLAIIIVSILIGGLLSGADSVQLTSKLPFATVNILQGMIFFCLLASEKYVRKFSQPKPAGAQA
jgi:general nucleoside transport system permease protein